MIKEFCYYSLYVCLISFIAFGQRDEMSYRMNSGLINMLGKAEMPGQITFNAVCNSYTESVSLILIIFVFYDSFVLFQVSDGHKFWSWLETTYIPSVFYMEKYNGDLTTMRERNYTNDMVSFRVGPLRLRQVRVQPGRSDNG